MECAKEKEEGTFKEQKNQVSFIRKPKSAKTWEIIISYIV